MDILFNLLGMGASVSTIAEKLGVNGTVDDVVKAVTNDPAAFEKLQNYNLELQKLEFLDRGGARQAQSVKNTEGVMGRYFIYYFAIFWSLFSAAYFVLLTIHPIETGSRDFANIILGFLLGTALTSIFMFFYGSSKGSKDKTDAMVKGFK